MIHALKTLPEYFNAVQSGAKTAELRVNDRGFEVNDTLHLQEYVPQQGYTGRFEKVLVTHITAGPWLADNHVMLSFKRFDYLDEGCRKDAHIAELEAEALRLVEERDKLKEELAGARAAETRLTQVVEFWHNECYKMQEVAAGLGRVIRELRGEE